MVALRDRDSPFGGPPGRWQPASSPLRANVPLPCHARYHSNAEPTRAPPKAPGNSPHRGSSPRSRVRRSNKWKPRSYFPLSPPAPPTRRRLPAPGPAALPRGCAGGLARYLRGRCRHVALWRPGVRLRRSPPDYNSREAAEGPPHTRGGVCLQRRGSLEVAASERCGENRVLKRLCGKNRCFRLQLQRWSGFLSGRLVFLVPSRKVAFYRVTESLGWDWTLGTPDPTPQ